MKLYERNLFRVGIYLIFIYIILFLIFYFFRVRISITTVNLFFWVGFVLVGLAIFKLINKKFKVPPRKIKGIEVDRLFYIGILITIFHPAISLMFFFIFDFLFINIATVIIYFFLMVFIRTIQIIGITITCIALFHKIQQVYTTYKTDKNKINTSHQFYNIGIKLLIFSIIAMIVWRIIIEIINYFLLTTNEPDITLSFLIYNMNFFRTITDLLMYFGVLCIGIAIFHSIPEKYFILKFKRFSFTNTKFYRLGVKTSIISLVIWAISRSIIYSHQFGGIGTIGEGMTELFPWYFWPISLISTFSIITFYLGLVMIAIVIYESIKRDSFVVQERPFGAKLRVSPLHPKFDT